MKATLIVLLVIALASYIGRSFCAMAKLFAKLTENLSGEDILNAIWNIQIGLLVMVCFAILIDTAFKLNLYTLYFD